MDLHIFSLTKNKVLMQQAREVLSGNWWKSIGFFLFFTLLGIIFSGAGGLIVVTFVRMIPGVIENYQNQDFGLRIVLVCITAASIIGISIFGIGSSGVALYSITLVRHRTGHFVQGFDALKRFQVNFFSLVLMIIFVLLWSLLLIIPGLTAMLSYSMVFHIIADKKESNPFKVIRMSYIIMKRNRWKLICLNFRFFGWFLLSLLTFGLGFLWLIPYYCVSIAQFYNDLKKVYTKNIAESDEGDEVDESHMMGWQ